MYHCHLIFLLFTKNTELISAVQALQPAQGFTHEIKIFNTFTPQTSGDIVVLDLPFSQALPKLASSLPKSQLIYCASPAKIAELTSQDYALLADIWPKSYPVAFASFQLQQLLEKLKLKQELELNQTYLETTIDSLPDMIWYKDIQGKHLKVNRSFCQAVGKTKDEVQGRGHYYIWDIPQEEYEKGEYVCLETDDAVVDAGKTCLFDEFVKSGGRMRQFKTYKSPIRDSKGEIVGTVGIARDVTDLGNMGVELDILLRSMPFAIIITDINGLIVKLNDRFREYFPISSQALEGKTYTEWQYSILPNISTVENLGYNADGNKEMLVSLNETSQLFEIHAEKILDVFNAEAGELMIFKDITIERALNKQIIHNANTDSLTGLHNRRFFYAFMEKNYKDRLSIFYIDLDNFKFINDTYGHNTGDEVLIKVSQLLEQVFCKDIIARIGGDEFIVASLNDISLHFIHEKAQTFLRLMQNTFYDDPQLKILSASMGIALSQTPQTNLDDLIKKADLALYQAKKQGKAQYCIYNPKLVTN